MLQASDIKIECVAENFAKDQQGGSKLSLNLFFDPTGAKQEGESPKTENCDDTLKIRIVNDQKITDGVKNFIKENLGTFEFSEHEKEKTFVFELKINDINFSAIREAFETHFAKSSAAFAVKLSYEKSQPLDAFADDLKANSRVPLFLHLLENAQTQFASDAPAEFLRSLLALMEANGGKVLAPWVKILLCFSRIKMRCENFTYKKFEQKAFDDMDFEQKENFKEFFGALDNPLNNFVFSGQEASELKVTGRILNVLGYEFTASLPGLEGFLRKVEQM